MLKIHPLVGIEGTYLRDFKKILVIYVSVMVFSFLTVSYCYQVQNPYGDLSVEQARTLIEDTPSLIIVDVRTDKEFRESHVKDAINLCICDPNNLLDKLALNDEILIYCKSGVRSSEALRILEGEGYKKVYHMVGGIDAWKNAGYDVIED